MSTPYYNGLTPTIKALKSASQRFVKAKAFTSHTLLWRQEDRKTQSGAFSGLPCSLPPRRHRWALRRYILWLPLSVIWISGFPYFLNLSNFFKWKEFFRIFCTLLLFLQNRMLNQKTFRSAVEGEEPLTYPKGFCKQGLVMFFCGFYREYKRHFMLSLCIHCILYSNVVSRLIYHIVCQLPAYCAEQGEEAKGNV